MTEDRKERLDRELIELLNELRVAIPGVQVLFAFLLTVPFTQRFGDVSEFQKTVYFVTLLCAAVASAFLIAPSAYHRLRFRQRDKHQMVMTSNRLAIAGLAFLALAIIGVVLLITDVLYGAPTVIAVTALTALLFAGLWYALPLGRALREPSDTAG
jgi:Family of unknown function (DUF6328)